MQQLGVWSGRSCASLGASTYHHLLTSHHFHLSHPTFSFFTSLSFSSQVLSHSLFLYVYDLNDGDLGLQSTIFLLNFLLLENDSVIHCNSRVFLLILVFFLFSFFLFFHANMLQLDWAYLKFLAFMCSIVEKFVEIVRKYKVLTFSGIELGESEWLSLFMSNSCPYITKLIFWLESLS